jgi:septum formation protein
VVSDFDENRIPPHEPPGFVRRLAEGKARSVARRYPSHWVIGADTAVIIDGIVLGKPRSRAHACEMLRRLSGQTHEVLTGYCLVCQNRNRLLSDTVRTAVRFKHLEEAEIDWYVDTGEPFDKAGAYAIQGIGTFLVRSIEGSYTNVVGLPVCEVIEILLREGVIGFDHGAEAPDRSRCEAGR